MAAAAIQVLLDQGYWRPKETVEVQPSLRERLGKLPPEERRQLRAEVVLRLIATTADDVEEAARRARIPFDHVALARSTP